MVSVQASRFSLLNVDDDSDSADVKGSESNAKSQQKGGAKKKNKKKRKDQGNAETDQVNILSLIMGSVVRLTITYLFGVLSHFQHSTGHITTCSFVGRVHQYIQFVKVSYCTAQPVNFVMPVKFVTRIL